MTRLKRQILTLAISLGAVLAAKVYLNRKLALMGDAPRPDAEVTLEDAPSGAATAVTVEAPPPGPLSRNP